MFGDIVHGGDIVQNQQTVFQLDDCLPSLKFRNIKQINIYYVLDNYLNFANVKDNNVYVNLLKEINQCILYVIVNNNGMELFMSLSAIQRNFKNE